MRTIILNNGQEIAYEHKYYPNYFVTKSGNVYSIYQKGKRGKTDIYSPHLLSYSTNKDGYFRVVLSNKGRKTYIKVHTLIVEQFIGQIGEGQVVNHKDGNKQNNCLDNLEITTVRLNTQHAHATGLMRRDIPVEVIYQNNSYRFPNLKSCNKYFPELSLHYLKQLYHNHIQFSLIYFQKQSPQMRCSKIHAYYNGRLLYTFATMQQASIYFGKSKGAVSAAIKNCDTYRQKINQYIVNFSNVSTIENTTKVGSE